MRRSGIETSAPRRRARRWAVTALAGAAIGAGLTSCSPPPTAGLSCAWANKTDPTQLNVAYPDTNATYFTFQYQLFDGQQLVLRGSYPAARYFSFTTYNTSGNAIDSTSDRLITPDPGSANPYVDAGASSDMSLRHFTVRVTAATAATHGGNAISASTGSGLVSGFLTMRVYIPDNAADLTGGAGLPALSVSTNGAEVAVPTCATQVVNPALTTLVNLILPDPTATPGPTPIFTRQNGDNLFPNPDNAYASTLTSYQPGRVVVVTGKSPSTPDTRGGDSPTLATDMRYWSLCNNEYRRPFPVDGVNGCAADHGATLDGSGDYTFVVSPATDRPATADAAHGVTWLDWTNTSVTGVLIMRNMVSSPTFAHSIAGVAVGDPVTTTMGAYAPIAKYCTSASFDAVGAAACS